MGGGKRAEETRIAPSMEKQKAWGKAAYIHRTPLPADIFYHLISRSPP
jgi:hypothetical protein